MQSMYANRLIYRKEFINNLLPFLASGRGRPVYSGTATSEEVESLLNKTSLTSANLIENWQYLPEDLRYSYFLPSYKSAQETSNEEVNNLRGRLINLFNILGSNLFNKLTYEQVIFMANTAGVVDLGPMVNVERIYKSLIQE